MTEDIKFTKETIQRGGSIPFWDHTYSAWLTFEQRGTKVWLDAFELIELKKLLNKEFDGRTGEWKVRMEESK